MFSWESENQFVATGNSSVGTTVVFDQVSTLPKGNYLLFADIPCYVSSFTGGYELQVGNSLFTKKTDCRANNNISFAKLINVMNEGQIRIKLSVKVWANSGSASCYFANYSTKTVKLFRIN